MIGTNQPDLVVAILRELDRQQPGRVCGEHLFSLICRAADEIVAAANAKPVGIWARDVIRYQRDVTPLTRSAMMGLWAWSRANPGATFEDFLAASERAIAVSGGA